MTKELLAVTNQQYQVFLNDFDGHEVKKRIQAENFLSNVLHNQLVDMRNNNAISTSQIGNHVIEYLNWMDKVLGEIK
jgi:transcriptional regulator NrdR family protein